MYSVAFAGSPRVSLANFLSPIVILVTALADLAGWGALGWRENALEGSRIGIAFLYLDEQSLAQLACWLQRFAPISFIPKHCHSHPVTSSP